MQLSGRKMINSTFGKMLHSKERNEYERYTVFILHADKT